MKKVNANKLAKVKSLLSFVIVVLALLSTHPPTVQAFSLTASDGDAHDFFGVSVSLSGNHGLVGADMNVNGGYAEQGAAYLFRDLNMYNGTGHVTQNAKLIATDGAVSDEFGISVSLSSTMGLVGAEKADISGNQDQGAAYLFRNLDTATGNVTEHAKLIASDGGVDDQFGSSVSLSGTMGLVGAVAADISGNEDQGAAYLFRNLDTATGTVTENAKLIASDGGISNLGFGDYFGISVSLSNNMGLVGAPGADISGTKDRGAAYLFRNLDTATGTVTENAKLIASDGVADDYFGFSVSLSGNMGLVMAVGADIPGKEDQGAAYLFRNLDTATGTVTEAAKLIASDSEVNRLFGSSAYLSDNMALLGSAYTNFPGKEEQGAAYLFLDLDMVSGNVTESVKLFASDGAAGDHFGSSVSLDGGRLIVGAEGKQVGGNYSQGKAYFGFVWTFLTADIGNDNTDTDGLSFISREDWIIGTTTSNNTVTLSSGDSGNVTATGKGVYIGDTWSGENTLHVSQNATLNANHIQVGKADGLGDNELKANGSIFLSSGGNVTVQSFNILSGNGTISGGDVMIKGSLRPGNSIGMLTVSGGDVIWKSNDDWVFELGAASSSLFAASTSNTTQDLLMITGGDFLKGGGSSFTFDFQGTGSLGWYKLVDWDGTTDFTSSDFSWTNLAGGYLASFTVDAGTSALYVQVVPEPSTAVLLLAGAAAGLAWRRRG